MTNITLCDTVVSLVKSSAGFYLRSPAALLSSGEMTMPCDAGFPSCDSHYYRAEVNFVSRLGLHIGIGVVTYDQSTALEMI